MRVVELKAEPLKMPVMFVPVLILKDGGSVKEVACRISINMPSIVVTLEVSKASGNDNDRRKVSFPNIHFIFVTLEVSKAAGSVMEVADVS